MAQKTVITCDMCGKIKGESNHWYQGKNDGVIQIATLGSQSFSDPDVDLCGRGCAHKWIDSQFTQNEALERGKNDSLLSTVMD